MKKFYLFILLITFIISIGAISAEDVSIDDSTVADIQSVGEDIILDEIPTDTDTMNENLDGDGIATGNGGGDRDFSYTVTTSTDISELSKAISNGTYIGYTFNFVNGTYDNFTLKTGTNNTFNGNGATLIGDGSNYVFDVSSSNGFVINRFNILINSNTSNGISGSNVANGTISNNTIQNGGDAISIFMYYENLTIANNTITNMSGHYGDAISLVNNRQNFDLDSWTGANIYGNNISDVTYGIFIGGNFKGNISNNNIDNATSAGMQFEGKKNATNGKLSATISGNNITNVTTGIEMDHPNIVYLDLENNNITAINSTCFAINVNSYFNNQTTNNSSAIYVNNNNLDGLVNQTFIDWTDEASGNTGIGAYSVGEDEEEDQVLIQRFGTIILSLF